MVATLSSDTDAFFLNDTATTEIYPLSLHGALPIPRAYGGLGRADDRIRALARFAELSKKAKSGADEQRRALQLLDEAKSLVDAGDLPAAALRLEEARARLPFEHRLPVRLPPLHAHPVPTTRVPTRV